MDNLKSKTFLIELIITGICFYKFPTISLLSTSLILAMHFHSKYSKSTSKNVSNITMIAAIYRPQGDFGISNFRIPNFGSKELLIQVKAAAINPIDYKMRTCLMPFLRWFLPNTVGRDFSGIVVDIGKEITKFKIGDEVYGNANGGSLQEFTTVKESQIGLKASNLSFSEAASIGLAAGTSLQSLKFWGEMNNKKILIIGGSGGCGSLGVQIAKYFKANVTATCSGKNVQFVKEIGADKVIDYTKSNFLEDLLLEEFDLIFDTVTSSDDPNQEIIYRKFLKADGKYVAINAGNKLDWIRAFLFKAGINIERKNYHLLLLDWKNEDLNLLKKISEEGKLQTKFTTYQLDRLGVNEAFEQLMTRRTVGKLVFEI